MLNGLAQKQTYSDSVLNSLKVSRKVQDNSKKNNSVALLDSLKVKRVLKTKIKVAKDYIQPKSDSFLDIANYLVKKQFHDYPIISWVLLISISFMFLRIIYKFFKK
jgi:hypothetical protein